MPLIYDIKNKKSVRLDAENVYDLLEQPGTGFMPLPKWKYTVQDPETGEMEEVIGDKVRQRLRSGYLLHDTQEQRLRTLARSQGSALGEFGKQFLNEAVTFGIAGHLMKKKPKNDIEKMYDVYYKDEFKTSRSLGEISGLIGPFVTGNIFGAVSKIAGGKALSRFLKAIPSAKAIEAINKLGGKTSKAATKAAQRLGIKNKTALKMIGGAGRSVGWAAGDTALFASKRGIDAGFDEASYDRSFNIKSALSETRDASKEIFGSSFVFGSGLLFAGGAIGATARTAGRFAKKTGKFTADKVRESDLAHLFRSEFFNTPNSQKNIQVIAKRISYSHRFLKNHLTPQQVKKLYNDIPDNVKKTKNIKPDSIDLIVRNSNEKNVINLSTQILKDMNGGKFPKTRKEVFELMKNLEADNTLKLSKGREFVMKKYSDTLKNIQKQKDAFTDKKTPFRALVQAMPNVFQKNLDDLAKLKMRPKNFWTKRKLNKSKFYYDPSLDENMRSFYKDVFSLARGKKAKFPANPKKQLEQFMEWVVYHSASFPKINKVSDLLRAERTKDLFKIWKQLGLSEKTLPVIQKQLKIMMDLHPTNFQEYFDFSKMNTLFNSSSMKYKDLDYLRKTYRRYIDPTANNEPYMQYIKQLSNAFDELLPSQFFVQKESILPVIDDVVRALSEVEKIGAKAFVTKAQNLQNVLGGQKRVSLFDLNKAMQLTGDLSSFLKKTPNANNLQFRKLYSKLSALEDDVLRRLERSGQMSKNIVADIIESKGRYSLSKVFLDIFDAPVRSLGGGGSLSFRDLMFAAGGIGGGGAALISGNPILAVGALGASWAAAKGVSTALSRGSYFLHMADKIDHLSKYVKRQNNVYRKFKDHSKLNSFIKSPRNLRELNVNLATLSYLFFNQPSENFEDFYDKLTDRDMLDTLSDTQKEVSSVIEAIGGDESGMDANNKIVDLKQAIIANLPKGKVNPITGKKEFSAFSKNKFFYTIKSFLDPSTFLNSFKEGTLTRPQAVQFSRLYPDHYNSLVISAITSIKQSPYEWSLRTRRSLDILTHNQNKAWLYHFDAVEKEKRDDAMQQNRAGGIKFSAASQPLQSQRIGGGKI